MRVCKIYVVVVFTDRGASGGNQLLGVLPRMNNRMLDKQLFFHLIPFLAEKNIFHLFRYHPNHKNIAKESI